MLLVKRLVRGRVDPRRYLAALPLAAVGLYRPADVQCIMRVDRSGTK